jgi:hypothetical protein
VDVYIPDGNRPDAGEPDAETVLWGRVGLTHVVNDPVTGGNELVLRAGFWVEPYAPPEVMPDPFMQTQWTPDGVACDSYFCSGMDPGCPPGLPPGPVQGDGGRIRAGMWGGDGPMMEVVFNGQEYTVDRRVEQDPNHPIPGWLQMTPFMVHIIGDGSQEVTGFLEELDMPVIPTITAPVGGDLTAGPDGNILISWQSPAADETAVRLDLTNGSEWGIFFCRPDPNTTSLLFPTSWLMWPSAQGVLRVETREYVDFYVPRASVVIRGRRVRSRTVIYHP